MHRHGLTANAVEGVVRSALSVASHFPQPHSDPDCACCKGIDAALQGSLQYNMERMKLIDPTSRWFCEDVARIHITVNKDPAQAMQVGYAAPSFFIEALETRGRGILIMENVDLSVLMVLEAV